MTLGQSFASAGEALTVDEVFAMIRGANPSVGPFDKHNPFTGRRGLRGPPLNAASNATRSVVRSNIGQPRTLPWVGAIRCPLLPTCQSMTAGFVLMPFSL